MNVRLLLVWVSRRYKVTKVVKTRFNRVADALTLSRSLLSTRRKQRMASGWLKGYNLDFDHPFKLALVVDSKNIEPVKLERSSGWQQRNSKTEAWLCVPAEAVSSRSPRTLGSTGPDLWAQ